MLLSQFTPEFKEVYDEMIAKMKLGHEKSESEPSEDEAEDKSSLDIPEFSPEFKQYIEDTLNKCSRDYFLEEKHKAFEAAKKKDRKVKKANSDEIEEFQETDSLSGVWRMLDAESVENGFPMSKMNYDIYDDKRFKWLKRDEISWNQMEVSKKKCEGWLKAQMMKKPESPDRKRVDFEKRKSMTPDAERKKKWKK